MSERSTNTDAAAPAVITPVLRFDTQGAVPVFANVFQASVSAEEVILDFGLFDQRQPDSGPASVPVSQRLVLNWTTARRLADFLSALLRHHEATRAPGAREAGARQPSPRP